MNKKVVIGMSGGVDSSVGAFLLKEQGYDVIGVTMKIWDKEDSCTLEREGGCCGLSAVEDARKVADYLNIPYYVINFYDIFKEKVIDYFIDTYRKGETPNPCISCNRYVKWEALLKKAKDIGCDYLSTGHYANIVNYNNRLAIAMSKTIKKDQSYALYNLTQEQLKNTIFPCGSYEKSEIREIGKKAGIPVFEKKDSQDICFVENGDYVDYIKNNSDITIKKGNYIGKNGEILGEHKGFINYTIGQRKGLGIGFGVPKYVTKIDSKENKVYLGDKEDILKKKILVGNLSYMGLDSFNNVKAKVKIRYNHKGEMATIKEVGKDMVEVEFYNKTGAIAPGQAAVFYHDNIVLGGGIILGEVY